MNPGWRHDLTRVSERDVWWEVFRSSGVYPQKVILMEMLTVEAEFGLPSLCLLTYDMITLPDTLHHSHLPPDVRIMGPHNPEL